MMNSHSLELEVTFRLYRRSPTFALKLIRCLKSDFLPNAMNSGAFQSTPFICSYISISVGK
jgi:hypothetical protein